MITRNVTKADFDYIVSVLDRWWGGPSRERAHPLFFYELGREALVAEEDEQVIGFLLGFVAPLDPPCGYVHLVGIHPDCRRRGVGQALYREFFERCRARGADRIKAIATLGNEGSVKFHESMGFTCEEVEDYAGPSRPRLVFSRPL